MVASILDRPIRRNAFAARLGGDEFVIVSKVAEGIETERQREILEEVGCRFGQGFLFSRPVELSRLIGEGEQSRDKGHSRRERLR